MSDSLFTFVSAFEQENPDIFSLVKLSVSDLENTCLRRNQESCLENSIVELNRKKGVPKSISSSSIDKCTVISTTIGEPSTCSLDNIPDDPQAATSLTEILEKDSFSKDFGENTEESYVPDMVPIVKSISFNPPEVQSCVTPVRASRTSMPYGLLVNEDIQQELSESPGVKPVRQRVPFFALNIKTLKLSGIYLVINHF